VVRLLSCLDFIHVQRFRDIGPDAPTTLMYGRMEGWVRIRIAGQTDWKRVWMVVSAGADSGSAEHSTSNVGDFGTTPTPISVIPKKKRISLFSRESNWPPPGSKPLVSIYASPKPKDKTKALLTFKNITQAFAVYPEKPELISRSTLIKVEGSFGHEDVAAFMKSRQGWLLIMPESDGIPDQAAEMLKWVVGMS